MKKTRYKFHIAIIYGIGLALFITTHVVLRPIILRAGDAVILSEKEDKIYATLQEAGYSHAGICGIMGNIAVENPKFQADLEANKGVTYGLFQWSNVGDRRDNLIKYCNNRSLYPSRIDGQMAFAMHELDGGDPIACRANDFLKETDSSTLAAMEFAAGFERCVGGTKNTENDGIYEGKIYPEYYGRKYQALSQRIERANYYYSQYFENRPAQDKVIEITVVPKVGIVAETEDSWEEDVLSSFDINMDITTGKGIFLRSLCVVIGYAFGSFFLIYFLGYDSKGRKRKRSISNFKSVNRTFDAIVNADAIKESPAIETSLERKRHIDEYENGINEKSQADRKILIKKSRIKHILLVAAWDIVKTYLAFAVAFYATGGSIGRDVILWTGLGVILGNDFPFWNRLRGGNGTMVTAVTLCNFMPLWGPICCLVGVVISLIAKSLPLGVFVITLMAVPFAFTQRGMDAGIIVMFGMVLMFCKLYRYISAKVKSHCNYADNML